MQNLASNTLDLYAFSDLDWVGCSTSHQSTTGFRTICLLSFLLGDLGIPRSLFLMKINGQGGNQCGNLTLSAFCVSPNIGKNGPILLFLKIFCNLPLFAKYLAIYLKLKFVEIEFSMELEFIKLKYNDFFLKFFYVTRLHGTRVT